MHRRLDLVEEGNVGAAWEPPSERSAQKGHKGRLGVSAFGEIYSSRHCGVNCLGDVMDPKGERSGGALTEDKKGFVNTERLWSRSLPKGAFEGNTTIGAFVTTPCSTRLRPKKWPKWHRTVLGRNPSGPHYVRWRYYFRNRDWRSRDRRDAAAI